MNLIVLILFDVTLRNMKFRPNSENRDSMSPHTALFHKGFVLLHIYAEIKKQSGVLSYLQQ